MAAYVDIGAGGDMQRAVGDRASIERLEQIGDFDRAFGEMALRNAAIASPVWLDGQEVAHRELVARILSRPAAAYQGRSGSGSNKPIFIVGLPRSGTTLVEQILDTHPRAQGMGELTALYALLQQHVDGSAPERLTAATLRQLAAAYLRAVRDQGWDGERKFVDKSFINYEQVGLIHLMFPNATVLHTVRDPMDVCFAGFRASFGQNYATWFTCNLAQAGRNYRRYRNVMDQWAKVLPGRVVDVPYEPLVADFEAGARRLVAACGLAWDERCLRFYDNPRQVRTASAAQVRQPITADYIGRWRPYAAHLGPLIAALGPYAAAV